MLTLVICSIICLMTVTSGHVLQKRDDNAEALIDEFIYEAVQEMKGKHQEQIDIPNIDENFQKKIAFIKVRGEFIGKDGWFRDLTTLKRTASSELIEKDNTITVGISLGLNDMEFGFKEYSAEVWHIGIHGTMRVSVEENSLYASLTMLFNDDGSCKTTLNKVEVRKLNGFHADMTGLGRDADWVYSLVVSLLANKYHKDIEHSITAKLGPAINQALLKKDICQQFPH